MSMMTDRSDRILLIRVMEGDGEAFGDLFDRHARAVYNYSFRWTADRGLAEDLLSATFLEAWRRRDVFLEQDSALPWLLGVATNLLRNQRRAIRRYGEALRRMPPPGEEPDFAESVAERMDDETRMRGILELLTHLRPADRALIHLCVWTGASYEDAARILKVPVGTVRSRLARARARLRDLAQQRQREEAS